MNFVLFVGAGNIIFPPFVGLMAGTNVWIAACGFLLTGVGLPVITSIAMARVAGHLPEITQPIGKVGGTILIVVCYLAVGPLFATPRTATVSYDLAIKPFYHSEGLLWIYSLLFFLFVIFVSLHPQKLFETVGKVLSPIKIAVLAILGITVFILPAGEPGAPQDEYAKTAFSFGLSNGYLTMDTLAALVFGLVIVNSIRSRTVTSPKLITRYAIYSSIIAGLMLVLLYVSLFRLGTASTEIAKDATNGADVLSAYVNFSYGSYGNILLAVIITVACLVTAIGLTCSGSSYFCSLTGIGYRRLVWVFAILSMVISNLGLTQLIAISVPAMEAIYPVFIVLIFLSFVRGWINTPMVIALPATVIAFVFGIAEGLKSVGLARFLPNYYQNLPLSNQGLAWVIPCIIVISICWIFDLIILKPRKLRSAAN